MLTDGPDAADKRGRFIVLIEWLLVAGFSCVLAFQAVPDAWRTLNTDFPNYYLAAQLAREGVDAAQAYDWRWLARQKDHHAIDRALVGLVPITPFSTLAVYPLTRFDALTAKRVWIALQLALLLPIALALREITGQPLRRIALVTVASVPLYRNLLYGQFYILLLALLVGACWAHQREKPWLAGALVGIAAACKIFPLLFLLYFLRKRDWRAASAMVATLAACAGLSIASFGWEMHRTYLQQVLPWTLRGDILPPFHVGSGSVSTLLHCLFLYEPQWNPHPWHASPVAYAVLQGVIPMLLLAPALLLVDRHDRSARRIALEWSALLVAALTISTVPAPYNFTLLILPVMVLLAWLESRRIIVSAVVFALYMAIAYAQPWDPRPGYGPHLLLQFLRLYLLVVLVAMFYFAIGSRTLLARRTTKQIAAAIAVVTVIGIAGGIRRLRGIDEEFAYRLPDHSDAFLSGVPQRFQGDVTRVAMRPNGYRVLQGDSTSAWSVAWPESVVGPDEIAFAANGRDLFVEQAARHSRIVSRNSPGFVIDDAESPTISADGDSLAYIRVRLGRGRLYVRSLRNDQTAGEPVTPVPLRIEEAAFLGDGSMVVAAREDGTSGSSLWRIFPGKQPTRMGVGEARYPAASPDGRWLAYSVLEGGAWHLAVLDLKSGERRMITRAACNAIEPAWESDSKTLLYGSDCGRALWFTTVSRRTVVR